MLIVDVQNPADMTNKVRVGVLGSCRARDLLVNVYKSEEAEQARGTSIPCETVAYNFGIFTHTPSQASQYYNFLKNRTEFMEEIQPLVFWKPLSEVTAQLRHYTAELLQSIDLMVVEASTLNNFTCNGVEVNASYVEQKFIKPGGKPLLKWWRTVSDSSDSGHDELDAVIAETLAALPSKDVPDSQNVHSIIRNLKRRIESKEQFRESMKQLSLDVGVPMVVLPHFDLLDAPIIDRHALRENVYDLAGDIGYDVFDTTDLIASFGRKVALAGDGTSVNHYSHSFHHTLLNHFRPFLHEVFMRHGENRAEDSRLSA